jgi:hypothetical protein
VNRGSIVDGTSVLNLSLTFFSGISQHQNAQSARKEAFQAKRNLLVSGSELGLRYQPQRLSSRPLPQDMKGMDSLKKNLPLPPFSRLKTSKIQNSRISSNSRKPSNSQRV